MRRVLNPLSPTEQMEVVLERLEKTKSNAEFLAVDADLRKRGFVLSSLYLDDLRKVTDCQLDDQSSKIEDQSSLPRLRVAILSPEAGSLRQSRRTRRCFRRADQSASLRMVPTPF
jgi:hypothetical protein